MGVGKGGQCGGNCGVFHSDAHKHRTVREAGREPLTKERFR